VTATGQRLRDFAAPVERAALAPLRSRIVGWLKYVLPAIAVVLITVVMLWPDMHRRGGFQISFAGIAEGEDGSVGMAGGQLHGIDRKGQPYTITAALAVPEKGNPDVMRLERPQADITTLRGAWISIRADRGTLDRAKHTLALFGNIDVFNDTGFEFHGQSARIDMKAGTIVSNEAVDGQGPLGHLTASALRGEDRGRHLFFEGPVRAVFYPARRGRA
jgi:lipopolysaccharide export system protein LptC